MPTRFYVSSFEYLKAPRLPIHPEFKKWAAEAGPGYITAIWHEEHGHTVPVAVHYETRKYTDTESSQIDYLQLSSDHSGRPFTHEPIGGLRVVHERHIIRKHKVLEYEITSDNWVPVRGTMFEPQGTTTMFPSKGDPGVRLYAESFSEYVQQTIWEVQNDKSIKIRSADQRKLELGSITADETVSGYVVEGPIQLGPSKDSKQPEIYRDSFFAHVLMALMIMPISRPANITVMLWWLKKLGGIALEGTSDLNSGMV